MKEVCCWLIYRGYKTTKLKCCTFVLAMWVLFIFNLNIDNLESQPRSCFFTVSFSAIYCWYCGSESIYVLCYEHLLGVIFLVFPWYDLIFSSSKIRIFHLPLNFFEKARPQLLCCRIAWLNCGQKGSSYALGIIHLEQTRELFYIESCSSNNSGICTHTCS